MLVSALCVAGCGDDSGGDDTDGGTQSTDSNPTMSSSNTASGPTTNPATTDNPTSATDPSGNPTSDTDSTDTSDTEEPDPTTTTTGEPSGDIAMFIALGQGGRRIVSCNDGQSWGAELIVEVSDDDHSPYSSRAVAYGDGAFVLGMGWGNPARMSRSDDGIEWTETFPPTGNRGLSGVDYGSGRFVAVEGRQAWISTDRGETWSEGGQLPTNDNVRVVRYSAYGDGLFYALVDGGLLYRTTDGVEWTDALPTQGSCDGGNFSRRGGAVDIDGVFYVVSDQGNVCRTDDGGNTITHHTFGGPDVLNAPIIAAGEFIYGIGGSGAWRSSDGMSWEQLSFQVDGEAIRTVAYSDETGTMIGISSNGDDFYRSTDGGASWTRAEGPAGNNTNRAGFGYVSSSETCP